MLKVNNYRAVTWTYPDEKSTVCAIHDTVLKEVVYTATIKRHVHDKPDKNKARMLSLAKVLQNISKDMRKEYWEVYRLSTTSKPRW